MKKILIISDSREGKHFIERISETYTSENIYYIVQTKATAFQNINLAHFKFYEFDPTSFYKLANLLKMDFLQVMIIMDNQSDVENTIKNIRTLKKQLRIIALNKWDLVNEDANIRFINTKDIIASRLIDYLPNVPVIAQNVGIGEGEMMEVLVPFGSSFVYRHIGAVEQKNWKIVAIYRNRKLILPAPRKMIHPNDLLVLVGEPTVLKSVYRSIKRELGQFPEPFGTNLLLFIDMNIINHTTVSKLVKQALYVHQKLQHDFIIRVVNPSNIELLAEMKRLRSINITIAIDYDSLNFKELFCNDIKKYHIGVVITSQEMFANYYVRRVMYDAHLPILKLAERDFSQLKEAVLLLSDNRDLEKISATIFDIAEQMHFNIELYNYLQEHQGEKEQVIEHYSNLASIFSKSMKVRKLHENPIMQLKKESNFIQIVPFTKKVRKRRIFSLFSTDSEKLYYKLDAHHQIFIPVQL